uniref:Glycosyltransferase N-terminal domain-containing protein n=1 Tax=Leersia perrieri TaxID=77586 RepID=A0A0D9V6W0_9ORYZ
MASTAAASRLHVVAVPYPGRGHINPMLAACRHLAAAAADGELTFTVVVTEEWHGLLAGGGAATPPAGGRVRLATIPNVIPSEHGRGADPVGFFEAVDAKMGVAVGQLLDRMVETGRRPDAIVADTYLTWGVEAGAARGIPVCSLWTMAATFFWMLYNLDLWPPVDDTEGEQELRCKSLEQYVPGCSSLRLSDIKVFRSWERAMKLATKSFVNVRKAQCVLFTSFYELEPCAIDRIRNAVPFPVYPIGPSISPSTPLNGHGEIHDEQHRAWLDAQPASSVLYVSFGSVVSVRSSQMEEIAAALRDGAVRFFWVARDGGAAGAAASGEKGLVVPWCDQVSVLRHRAVGGFLSHCGWNSLLEAVFAGVPLLALPVVWDQVVDARVVAGEWGIGVDLSDSEQRREDDGVVGRDAIRAAAARLMDPDDGESREMRRRAARLREACRGAVQDGGSSRRSLNSFVRDLADGRLNFQYAMAAAAADAEPRRRCHVVAVPYPGRGHVNAMMNLSRLLAARGAAVTFVVTEEWLGLLTSSSPAAAAAPPGVRMRSIPNVIPSEHGRGGDHEGFLEAVRTRMEAPFENLLDRLRLEEEEKGTAAPVSALVADTYLAWVVGVGNRRGVPVFSLFPMTAVFFSAYYHFDSLSPWLAEDNPDQRVEHYIPNMASSSIMLSDLKPLIHHERTVKYVLECISSIRKVQGLLFTTIYELEASVIDSIGSLVPCPVYPIGPCIPYMTLENEHIKSNGEATGPIDYSAWLDSQPDNSVLYVSLGSFLSVSSSQLDEIALGLATSEVRFLWILREQSTRVRELVGNTNRGMILPWCDQLKVMCHPSVGGFLTHCGMNSTLEAVFAGVPMLTLPLFFDQPIDGRLIEEEWKIGVKLRDWTDKDQLIRREEIARSVKRLMASDDAEIEAIRQCALEWKEISRKAVVKGGSSHRNLTSLMEMICSSR